MIQSIFGEYDIKNNRTILCILSDKNYNKSIISCINTTTNITNTYLINIKKYYSNIQIINQIELGNKYIININNSKNKQIDNCNLNLEINPFDNIYVVNCDCQYGFETKTWNKLYNKSKNHTSTIFHIGDQIYNDKYVLDIYYKKKSNEFNKKLITKELYIQYLKHFTRNEKSLILKNNFNIMIPDDHDVIDDSFINSHSNDKYLKKIFNLITNITNKIQLSLKFNYSNEDFMFIEDTKNNTIYMFNCSDSKYTENKLIKYDVFNKFNKYKNIVIFNRKIFLSEIRSSLYNFIFGYSINQINNNDPLLSLLIKLKKCDTINILCGDEHAMTTTELLYYNKYLLNTISVGSINSAVDFIGVNYNLDSKIKSLHSKYKNRFCKNGFVKINYINDKLTINLIKNKLNSVLYNVINYGWVGCKLTYYFYIKKYFYNLLNIMENNK